MNHCEHCPLKGTDIPCLGHQRPSVCGFIAREVLLNDARQRHWHDRVMGSKQASVIRLDSLALPPELPKPAPLPSCDRIKPLPNETKPRGRGLARELVVAKYREPIDWVVASPMPTTVYDKCPGVTDVSAALVPDHVKFRRLPNRGREAGSYLTHICDHFDDLAEWTYFTQAAPHNASLDEFWARLEVPYTDTTSLTAEYSPDYPSDEIKGKDVSEWHGGWEVRLGLVAPLDPEWSIAANLPTSEVWGDFFTSPMPDPFLFGYAAQWAVPRHRITARPLSWWRYLRDKVHATDSVHARGHYNPWEFEMIWLYAFGDATQYVGRDFAKPIRQPMTLKQAKASGLVKPSGCGCRGNR